MALGAVSLLSALLSRGLLVLLEVGSRHSFRTSGLSAKARAAPDLGEVAVPAFVAGIARMGHGTASENRTYRVEVSTIMHVGTTHRYQSKTYLTNKTAVHATRAHRETGRYENSGKVKQPRRKASTKVHAQHTPMRLTQSQRQPPSCHLAIGTPELYARS
jgi:hypothetical protein